MERPPIAICARCGAELVLGARFCATCGAAVEGCPTCGAPVPAGASFCASCGRSIAAPPRSEERKLVTVLFADLVDSTRLAETRDPERVARILERYAVAMQGVLESWGGTVEKYIGDAVVAAFGVPAVREDDARRALLAALEMQDRLEALNDRLEPEHGVRLQLRIGVNTGAVLAQTAGRLDQRFLAGDVVNVAARLEQAADPGQILVAGRTAESAGAAFTFDHARGLDLKGKTATVVAHRLVAVAQAPAAIRGLQAPLVGRARELRALREGLEEAIATRIPHLLVVFGPAGIGKSRLVREFLDDARSAYPNLSVLQGRCPSSGPGITYWAFGEIVRQACGIALDVPIETARRKLEAMVEDIIDEVAGGARAAREITYALATTAGIVLPENPLDDLRPLQVVSELGRAWPRFASAWSRRAPTVLLVEDLHWADEQLLGTLEHIVARADGPLLLLATARPEFAESHPTFALTKDRVSSLALRPLDALDGERMVEGLLGEGAIRADLQTTLLARAEGNPFFLEQLVSSMVDAGRLVRDGGQWRATTGDRAVALPDSVHGVLAARIDRLADREKRTLQEAAVVGRTFWAPALALSLEESIVAGALEALEAKELVVGRPTSSLTGETEYVFKHVLLREVTYESIPLARRARSHARVAAWLEGFVANGEEGVLEMVADHLQVALLGEGAELAWAGDPDARAELRARAFRVMLAAGAVARRRNAMDRALTLHAAALELAENDRERAMAFEDLGDDHGWSYHGDPSTEAWTHALELRRAMGDDEACARICLKAARHAAIYWGGFAIRPSGDVVDALVDEGLSKATDPTTRAWLLALRALASESYTSVGRPDPRPMSERIDSAEESAALARAIDDPDIEGLALRSLGSLYAGAGEPVRALELAEQELQSLDRVVATRDRHLHTLLAAQRLMDIGGEFERALALSLGVRDEAQETSAHERMHATYFVMAALYRLGRFAELAAFGMEHLAAFDEESVDMNCPFTRGGPVIAALAFERLGHSDEAREADRRIVPNTAQPGLTEAWMAERALASGDPNSAREIAEAALAAGRGASIEEPPYELAVLVEALAALGEWDALDAVLPTATRLAPNVIWIAPAIDRAHAARALATGDVTAARRALDRAVAAYRRLGMLAEETATLDRLAALPTRA